MIPAAIAERGVGQPRGWRVLVGLAVVSVALFAAYSGVLSVLLPTQIATIDPGGKVASLAFVTSLSFAVTACAQPLVGALSDRTRSRWGRRLPWMVIGGVAGAAALVGMGAAQSVAVIAILWAVGQFALNGTDIAYSAYLVDRFTARRRGSVAALTGLCAVVGGAAGSVFAGRAGAPLLSVYAILAVGVVGAVCLFAVLVRDPPSTDLAPPSGGFFRGFWVSPRRSPNFALVMGWRFLFAIAYGCVHGFLLYLLTDYVGVEQADALALVGTLTVVGGAGVIVAVLVGGWWSDRLGRRTPFLIAAGVLIVAGDLVAVVAPGVPSIFILAGCLGISLGLAISCGLALASETIPDQQRGAARGLGMVNFAANLGQAAAPLITAAAVAITGGYAMAFIVSAGVTIAGTVLVSRVRVHA